MSLTDLDEHSTSLIEFFRQLGGLLLAHQGHAKALRLSTSTQHPHHWISQTGVEKHREFRHWLCLLCSR